MHEIAKSDQVVDETTMKKIRKEGTRIQVNDAEIEIVGYIWNERVYIDDVESVK